MSASVTIVDYGSGNLRSAQKALERAAREAGSRADILVTNDPDHVRTAERVVIPGVGAFADCRNGLVAIEGMIEALTHVQAWSGRPILGICVGMQLMAAWGHEDGNHEGLGWIDGHVKALADRPDGFDKQGRPLKLPHMGWNTLAIHEAGHPVLEGLHALGETLHAYFVHSYHFMAGNPAQVLATTDYGGPFAAIVGTDNLIGMQFHPEKSQAVGLAILRNFLNWRP